MVEREPERLFLLPVIPMSRALRVAIPNKGRLSDDSVDLLRRAGITLDGTTERRLFASALNGRLQVLFARASDIPGFIADGTVDCGFTGHDAVKESGAQVKEELDLGFGTCRLVLAVPAEDATRSARDLPDGVRIATTFPRLTEQYFRRKRKPVRIVTVSGACEVAPTLGVADAITDLTSSGSTLAVNHLREVDTLLASSCRLVRRRRLEGDVAEEFDRLRFALESVIAARGKRYLAADVPRSALKEVQAFLPGLAGPTVVELAGNPKWVAIQVVVDDSGIFDAVHRLKQLGAKGILVMPIDRMVA
jgi:ATP phosphoribosyltransferase